MGGIDIMVRHINAGANDLDRASIGYSERISAPKDSLNLYDLDLK